MQIKKVTNKIIFITTFLAVLLNPFNLDMTNKVQANNNASIYYDIEVTVGTQSAWNNKVPITIKFKPTIDSLKTDVSWDIPIGVKIENNFKNYFPTKAGEVYTVQSYLIPEKAGAYDLAVTITAWNTESNYSNSQQVRIEFNKSLIVTPLQPGYTMGIGLKIFIIIAGAGIAGYLLIIGLKKGSKMLLNWLKPPEF